MQTFLPYSDFRDSAKCLDRLRLGKQRVENMQIMKSIITGKGWSNHPAVKMWKKYPFYLWLYQVQICGEWTYRGYKDTTLDKTTKLFNEYFCNLSVIYPPWLDGPIHATHRSNLYYKDQAFYGQYNWIEKDYSRMEYFWPKC